MHLNALLGNIVLFVETSISRDWPLSPPIISSIRGLWLTIAATHFGFLRLALP